MHVGQLAIMGGTCKHEEMNDIVTTEKWELMRGLVVRKPWS